MHDFNGDGKFDSKDYYIYSNFIDKGYSGGKSRTSNGKSFLTVIIIAIVASLFNELIGAAILFGYLYYELFLK